MANTSPVYARIDSKLKHDAEEIMEKLGITPTSLITMVYSQIVLKEELPFQPSIHKKRIGPFDINTVEDLKAAVQQGLDDVKAGRVYTKEEAKAFLKDKYGIWVTSFCIQN